MSTTAMQALNIPQVALEGIGLIEASAGTGKTFTIAGLFLRLVVEQGRPVESILVVTFTEAATAELRERIRTRLVEAEAEINNNPDNEKVREGLFLAVLPERDIALRRLRQAILGFDRAAIFTIHGFCQRVLQENAFESGQRFDAEVIPDVSELLQGALDDFWRLHVQDLPPRLAAEMQQGGLTAETLLKSVAGHLNRPYLQIEGGEAAPPGLEEAITAARQVRQRLAACWDEDRAAVEQSFLDNTCLNGNKYRPASREKWLDEMAQFLAGEGLEPFKEFFKFSQGELEAALKKNCAPAPTHAFFDLCEAYLAAWNELAPQIEQALRRLKRRLLHYLDQELAERKARAGQMAFDDMLLRVAAALEAEGGEHLAAAVRRRFGAALIDEFQDTDPLQYAIFSRIYKGEDCPLFLVGDPKQAIYSFRGADIFAYLKARGDAASQYTLRRNWRSEPAVIKAFNQLFDQPRSFLFEAIGFDPATPADKPERPLLCEDQAPAGGLDIWLLPAGEKGKPLNKADAQALSNELAAGEIARLLQGAADGAIRIGERPLQAGEIAVLVRSHTQGAAMQEALRRRGMHSVQRSSQSVFDSEEAMELERLLHALLNPADERLVRTALASRLLGCNGRDLHRLGEDERALEQEMAGFAEAHDQWRQRGFYPMIRRLLQQRGVAGRLLRLTDGERRLTNLHHLLELLNQQASLEQAGAEGLVKWLALMRQGLGGGPGEDAELRLESDEDLVQIVTIHRSKGLQYAVVFCPFLWDGKAYAQDEQESLLYHRPDSGQAVLDLGSEQWDAARTQAQREELAEALRLAYVGITRAVHRCYLAWGPISQAGSSPLGWLLHAPEEEPPELVQDLRTRFKGRTPAELEGRLEVLAEPAGGALRTLAPEVHPGRYAGGQQRDLSGGPRRLGRPLALRNQITSFTRLARSVHQLAVELPDYDAVTGPEPEPPPRAPGRDIFGFPRGSRAGTCLHSLFERLDFTAPAADEIHALASAMLHRFGFEPEWVPVAAEMTAQVLDTPLDAAGFTLRGLRPGQRLVEMEFHYPLGRLSAPGLRQLLQTHWGAAFPGLDQALQGLDFDPVSGYLRGFIDLIFEHQGRYFVADYKSNWLGDELAAYAPPALAAAVLHEGYYLQYLLYTLALHRLLQSRLPDYDYERHCGGVYYLFLRGMRAQHGAAYGVHFDRPPAALIQALDAAIAEEAA